MSRDDNSLPSIWLVVYSVVVTVLFGFYLREASDENQALTLQVKEISNQNIKLMHQLQECELK